MIHVSYDQVCGCWEVWTNPDNLPHTGRCLVVSRYRKTALRHAVKELRRDLQQLIAIQTHPQDKEAV